jgi:hypothetical protein
VGRDCTRFPLIITLEKEENQELKKKRKPEEFSLSTQFVLPPGFPLSLKLLYLVFMFRKKVIAETGLTEIDVDSHGYGGEIGCSRKEEYWELRM